MHHARSRLDLAPVLADLGYIAKPPTANVFLPTPNHSHVVINADINVKAICGKSFRFWSPIQRLADQGWQQRDHFLPGPAGC